MMIDLEGDLSAGDSIVDGGLAVDACMAAVVAGSGFLRRAWLDLIPPGQKYPPPPPPEIEAVPDGAPLQGSAGLPESMRWRIGAVWNVELAYRALDDPAVLPSWTGSSHGMSRIIRYVLGCSGIDFQVLSEVRNDAVTDTGALLYGGDHVTGNAIDVVGLHYEVVDTYTVTDRAHDEMLKIVAFVKQYPQLFTVALYGREGALTVRDGEDYQGWTDDELNANSLHIHLASSLERMRKVLHPSLWNRSGGTVTSKGIPTTTGVAVAYYSVGIQSSGASEAVDIATTVVTTVGSVKSADRVEKTGTAP